MLKRRRFFIAGLILALSLLIVACDAPRQNPFDPKASNYTDNPQQLVTSSVYVKHLYPPFAPIANVNLIIENLHLFLTTDAQGLVTFEHQPVDSLIILSDAEGYFNHRFTIKTIPTNQYTIYLNAKPEVKDVHFYSTYTNLEQSNSTTNLSFDVTVLDADGPLDVTVFLKNDQYNFSKELSQDPNNKTYFSTDISVADELNNLSTAQLPELNFYLVVKNLNQDSISVGTYSIRRVIDKQLQLLSPSAGQTVQDSVVFKWINPELSYDYEFTIQLLKYPTFEKIFYRGIGKDQDHLVVKDLTEGQYSWSLQVQDKLGNICQSYYIYFYYE